MIKKYHFEILYNDNGEYFSEFSIIEAENPIDAFEKGKTFCTDKKILKIMLILI